MKRYCVIFIICLLSKQSFSQISYIIPSSNSISQTSVSDSHHWAAFNNPAMLGNLIYPELGIHYENRYLISELSTKSIQFALPSNLVNTGISFSHFGYSLYHEMMIGMGFARNFGAKFAMGVQFNYYTAYFVASNSYRGTLFPQVGLSVKLSPEFSLGFNTFNPFQSDIKTEFNSKRLPSLFSLGTEYFFSTDLVWRTQIDKEVSTNYRFATGFEYQMLQQFELKLGAYVSNYLVPCMGVGFKTAAFQLNLNTELHPLLGLISQASVSYIFK